MWRTDFLSGFALYFHAVAQRWKLHQFKDRSGKNHFYDWYVNELDDEKQMCVNSILNGKLLKQGPGLVETRWLKIIKGANPSRERQTQEIEKASQLLEEWRTQNA